MNFNEALNAYRVLRRQLDSRQITTQEFSAGVAKLRVQDESGNWWQINERDGSWLRWDGAQWQPVSVPSPRREKATKQLKSPTTLFGLGKTLLRNLVSQSIGRLLLAGALGAGVMALHTYWMVFVNEGFMGYGGTNPLGQYLLAFQGNAFQAATFWALLFGLVSSLGVSLFRGKLPSTISQATQIPGIIAAAYRQSGPRALPVLAACASLGLIIGRLTNTGGVVNPLNSLILAGMVTMGLGSQKQGFLITIARALWSDLRRWFGKLIPLGGYNQQAATVGLTGVGLGLALAAILPTQPNSLIFAGVFVLLIVYLLAGQGGGRGATMVAMLSYLVYFFVLSAVVVSADDGGWAEAGGTFGDWVKSEGAFRALLMGLGPGIGAGIGVLFGGGFVSLDFSKFFGPSVFEEIVDGWETLTDKTYEEYHVPWDDDKDKDKKKVDTLEEVVVEEVPPLEEDIESKTWVAAMINRDELTANGKDVIWVYAWVASTDETRDAAALTRGISFSPVGKGAGWLTLGGSQMTPEGYKAVSVSAKAPAGLDSTDPITAGVRASVSGAKGDTANFTLKVVVVGDLLFDVKGPSSIKPDGADSLQISAGVRTTPRSPELEAKAASSVQFSCSSDWVRLKSVQGAESKRAVRVAAYPPSGDFTLSIPDDPIEIDISATFEKENLTASHTITLTSLSKWIRVYPGQESVRVDGETKWIQARVELVGDETVNLDAFTAALNMNVEGEGGDWLTITSYEVGEQGYKAFLVEAFNPYDDPGAEATFSVEGIIKGQFEGETVQASVPLEILPFPQAVILVDPDAISLRPDGENDEVVIQARVELEEKVEGVDVDKFTQSLNLILEGDDDGWLSYDTGKMVDNNKIFSIRVFYPFSEAGEQPPEVSAKFQADIRGKMIEQPISLEIMPLSTASIQTGVSKPQLRGDGVDEVEVWARLVLDPPDDTQDFQALAGEITFTPYGDTGEWLVEKDAGVRETSDGSYEAYISYTAQKPAEDTDIENLDPATVFIAGEVYGFPVETKTEVNIFPLSIPSVEWAADKKAVRPDGYDGAWITARVELSPADDTQDLNALTEELTFSIEGTSIQWASFDDESEQMSGSHKLIWLYAENLSGDPGAVPPANVSFHIKGEVYGQPFEAAPIPTIDLAPLPQATVVTRFEREVSPVWGEENLLPDGKDWVRLSAWVTFDQQMDPTVVEEIQQSITLTPLGDARDWLITPLPAETAKMPDDLPCKAVRLLANIPPGYQDDDDFYKPLTIEILGKYAGKEIRAEAIVNLLPLPVLTVDVEEVALVAGKGEPGEVIVKVVNPGDEPWTITWELEGEDPSVVDVQVPETHPPAEMTISLMGGELDPKVRQKVTNTLLIEATRGEMTLPMDNEPIEVEVVVGCQGLFVYAPKPLRVYGDKEKTTELELTVLVIKEDQVLADESIMQSEIEFSELKTTSDRAKNALEVADITFEYLRSYGSGAETRAVYAVRAQRNVPGGDEAGEVVSLNGDLTLKAVYGEPEFTKVQPINLEAISMQPGSEAWEVELERCKKIIDDYIPDYYKPKLKALLEQRKQILGARGLYKFRHQIWKIAVNLTFGEGGKGYEEYAKWAARIETVLDWTQWMGGIAFDALITAVAGPHVAMAAGLGYSSFQSWIVAYQEGVQFDLWLDQQIINLMVLPTTMVVDPARTVKDIGPVKAYALFIGYHFIVNLTIHKMNGWDAAYYAGRSAIESAIGDWLGKHVRKSARKHGYKVNVPYTIDELPTDARRMAENIADGRARLEDVLLVQQDPQQVRALKNAEPAVREAYNRTLREQIIEPHNQQLLQWVRDNVPGMENAQLRVKEFRTPGADASDINTDLDYTPQVLTENGWIEIPRGTETTPGWDAESRNIIRDITGFEADDLNFRPTDKYEIEASMEYSDQYIDPITGKKIELKSNILDVKEGNATLIDPQGLARMYNQKVQNELNPPPRPDGTTKPPRPAEAIAQCKKVIKSVEELRAGHEKQGYDVGTLPANMQEGMKIIRNAPVDHLADPADVNAKLQEQGYSDIGDFNKKLTSQIESLGLVEKK